MIRRWSISLSALALALAGLTAQASAAQTTTLTPTTHATATAAHHAATAVHPTGLPAGFNPGGRAHATSSATPHAHAAHGAVSNTTLDTPNWSGIVEYGASGSYTSVSDEWQQASLVCTTDSVQYVSFWVGLDGFNGSSVEQTGTLGICDGTTPEYYAWYEMYPAAPVYYNETVEAGILYFGSVVFSGTDTYTLTLQGIDGTPWKQTTVVNESGLANASAEVITEAPSSSSGILPLADFQRAHYRVSYADGGYMGSAGGQSPTSLVIVDSAGAAEDSTAGPGPYGGFYNDWIQST